MRCDPGCPRLAALYWASGGASRRARASSYPRYVESPSGCGYGTRMTPTEVDVRDVSEVNVAADLRAQMEARRPQHPALARLHDQLIAGEKRGEITSYDRMHHRHNRS